VSPYPFDVVFDVVIRQKPVFLRTQALERAMQVSCLEGLKMKMSRLWIGVAVVLAFCSSAHAQAFRTWVSGLGDDANVCSRTAPCKTFKGAILKTAAGGEIDILDSSGYGFVTITKSITIDGAGGLASILASGTTGIVIEAGPADVVTIRNLSINGVGTGVDGIRFVSGKALNVDNVKIFGFTSDGIEVNKTASGTLNIDDSVISDCAGAGIRIASSSGTVAAGIGRTRIQNCGSGIQAGANAVINIRDSDFLTNNIGLSVEAANAQASVFNVRFAGNSVGITATAGVARIIGNTFFSNNTGINVAGGNICSTGNNTFAGNTKNGSPSPNSGGCLITTQ
jgi:hypothetical protein